MFSNRFLIVLAIVLGFSSGTLLGQQAGGNAPNSIELLPTKKAAKVGEKIQFSVAVKDASGKALDEKPTAWFAMPFDLAAVDVGGTVSFYHPGQVIVGALVAGKPVFATITV